MLGDIVFPVELASRGDFGTTILTLLEPTKLYSPPLKLNGEQFMLAFLLCGSRATTFLCLLIS